MKQRLKAKKKLSKFLSDKLNEKVSNFDEDRFTEELLKFFRKTGRNISKFFTSTIPNIYNKIITLFESDTWGIIVPFLILMGMLVIIVGIATGFHD